VGNHTEAFVGIDTSKSRNAIAIADGGRGGEVRYLGEFPATEAAIRKLVAKLAEVVAALQAMQGIDLIAAVGVLAEIGDLSRFQNPRELMGYLGLVPSESSTGDKVKRGGITKAGNGRARRILVEAAWSYRYPPRVSREKQAKVEAAPRRVREIAWKAQTRLCGRFRSLERKGKRRTVVATAIARELSAFIWAINRELMAHRQA
jgi:transposase